MFGGSSSAFSPTEPPPYVGFPIPKQKFGSTFWNPRRSATGQTDLRSFAATVTDMFKFVPSAEKDALLFEVNKTVNEFKLEDYSGVNMDEDYVAELLGAMTTNQFETLKEAADSGKALKRDVFEKLGGGNLDLALSQFRGYGNNDARIILPFLNEYNNLSERMKQNAHMMKNNVDNFIEGLSDEKVQEACDMLGISDKTKDNLKSGADQMLDDLSSLGKFNQGALDKVKKSTEAQAIRPGVDMSGVSLVGFSLNQAKQQEYKSQKSRAEDFDAQVKKEVNTAISKKRAEEKQIIQKAEAMRASQRNAGKAK